MAFDALGLEGFPRGPITRDYIHTLEECFARRDQIWTARRPQIEHLDTKRHGVEQALLNLYHSPAVSNDSTRLGLPRFPSLFTRDALSSATDLLAAQSHDYWGATPGTRTARDRYETLHDFARYFDIHHPGSIEGRYAHAKAFEGTPGAAGFSYATLPTQTPKVGLEDMTLYAPIYHLFTASLLPTANETAAIKEHLETQLQQVIFAYGKAVPGETERLQHAFTAYAVAIDTHLHELETYVEKRSAQAARELQAAGINPEGLNPAEVIEEIALRARSRTWPISIQSYRTILVVAGELHLPSFSDAMKGAGHSLIGMKALPNTSAVR